MLPCARPAGGAAAAAAAAPSRPLAQPAEPRRRVGRRDSCRVSAAEGASAERSAFAAAALPAATASGRRAAAAGPPGRRGVRAASNGTGAGAGPSDGTGAVENVVIIGSGPAGYTAGIYAALSLLRPIIFEGMSVGGQLTTTTHVDNFPGFPEGVTGPDLMDRLRAQAERLGATLHTEDVEALDLTTRPFTVRGAETTVRAHAVIMATGATAKRLGIPAEKRFWSAGISACAICDGASFLFRG